MSHTPGPWLVETANKKRSVLIVSPSIGIATVNANIQREANAALIAAAPELLAALRDVLNHVEDVDAERIGNQCTLCFTCRTKIRAAIAKAEGRA